RRPDALARAGPEPDVADAAGAPRASRELLVDLAPRDPVHPHVHEPGAGPVLAAGDRPDPRRRGPGDRLVAPGRGAGGRAAQAERDPAVPVPAADPPRMARAGDRRRGPGAGNGLRD